MDNYASRFDWHKAVHKTVNDALGKCYPRDWKDEDHLTRSLLATLRDEHSEVTIEKDKVSGKNSKCHWDVYKNTKETGIEQKHGDIGVLVQLHFSKSKILEGVAFLEAKRIYHNNENDSKSKFGALDKSQLERYCNNSSFHRTVLYDCIKIDSGYNPAAFTLPTQHLLTINKDNRDIYPFCEYFSYCLTNRYFQGYELDFDPDLVNSVKGFLDSNGGVKYLIVAQSTLSPDLSLEPKLIEINDNMYQRLDSSEPEDTPTNNFGGMGM